MNSIPLQVLLTVYTVVVDSIVNQFLLPQELFAFRFKFSSLLIVFPLINDLASERGNIKGHLMQN